MLLNMGAFIFALLGMIILLGMRAVMQECFIEEMKI